MTALRRQVVAAVVCFALSIALHGCTSTVKKALDSMIATICANNIRTIGQNAQQQYQEMVFDKCQQLKEQALQNLNAEKAEDLHQRCLDSAGVSIEEEDETIEENYTDQCVKKLSNVSDFSSTTKAVKDWINSVNLTAVLTEDFQIHMDLKLEELQKEIKAGGGNQTGGENKTADDTKETDDTAVTTEEHSTTDEPKEDDTKPAKTTEEPEEVSTTEASTHHDVAKKTRLWDSRIQMHVSSGAGSAAVSLIAAGAFVGMLWLIVLRRRVGATSWDPSQAQLVDAESDIADA